MASRQRTVAVSDTIDLNRVRIFAAVVEAQSFTGAAKRLGLPKSSVSRSVNALEAQLGSRLLQRTTRALGLTDAGKTYFQQVRPALDSLNESAATLHARGTEPSGRIRFSCAPDSPSMVGPFITEFKKRYPKVRIDVSFTTRHVDLVAEGFDIALRAGTLQDSSLVARRLHATDLGLYAAPSYLRKRGTPKKLADLTEHDCIGMASPTGRGVWTLHGPDGAPESVEVEFSLSGDLIVFGARAAYDGLGIVMIPEMFARGLEGLTRVLPQYRQVGPALYVVTPSRSFEPKAVSLFKEGLIQSISALDHGQCSAASRKWLGLDDGLHAKAS